MCSLRCPFTDLLWRGGTRFAVHVIYIVQQIACHRMTGTCPATSRMICLFDDQSDAMSDRADLRYTICFANDAISSPAMNVSLRLVTKSKACEKVAKLRYQTIIYRTNADIVILPPFCSCPVSPDKWHAICCTIYIYM